MGYVCPAPLPQGAVPSNNMIDRRRVVAHPQPKMAPHRKNTFVMRPRKAPRRPLLPPPPPMRRPRRPRISSRRIRLLEKLVANAALQTLAVAKVVVDSSKIDKKMH